MNDLKKDEPIIDLTDVVEEPPAAGEGAWMEAAPPPAPVKKAPEPPKAAPPEAPRGGDDLGGIPDSPLKKFLLADEEPTSPVPSPAPGKPMGFSAPPGQPPRAVPEPPQTAPEPPGPGPQPFARPAPEWPPARPEPPRPPLPDLEAEMRSLREAMLSRVEKWAAQEGVSVLERVAREVFPRVAEEIIRREIEKIKAEAEERE